MLDSENTKYTTKAVTVNSFEHSKPVRWADPEDRWKPSQDNNVSCQADTKKADEARTKDCAWDGWQVTFMYLPAI